MKSLKTEEFNVNNFSGHLIRIYIFCSKHKLYLISSIYDAINTPNRYWFASGDKDYLQESSKKGKFRYFNKARSFENKFENVIIHKTLNFMLYHYNNHI